MLHSLKPIPTDSPLVDKKRHIVRVWLDWLDLLPVGEAIQDTRDNRSKYSPSASSNRFYRETDTGLIYISTGLAWVYVSGEYERTQSEIAALVVTLSANDARLIIDVTDFKHRLQWSGSALGFASGDDGSNYFIDAPSAPEGKVVQLCNGSDTTYLKADGTLGSYTTKNLTGHYRKSVTSGADATHVATAPTTQAHHHAVPDQNTATALTGITVDGHTTATDTNVTGAATRLTGPANHTVTDPGHHHDVPSQNTLDATVVVNADGEPAAYTTLTFFRR